MVSKETLAWANNLPHPSDTQAWDARCARMFTGLLKPQPIVPLSADESAAADAEFFGTDEGECNADLQQ